ncbi:MAG: hypothetical protein R2824_08855 [Saprospiraceae bacterium]|nr:hypothetical protein [Lewinella sp.]
MKYYFLLQYRRLERWVSALGVHPLIGYLIALVAFPAASRYLFVKTEFAVWIYLILCFSLLSALGERSRNDQLRSIFSKKDFLRIRLLENTLVALPFALYLSYEGLYYLAFGLPALSILLATFHFRYRIGLVLPTPFRRFPFEFISGFRRTFWLLLLAYFLLAKSIQVANFNLGLFALALLFFNGMSYYAQPEDEYFVWIYATDPKGFLNKKLFSALICISLLTAPLFLVLMLTNPDKWWIILGVQLLGCIFLWSMILAKYSAYPREINLPQAFLFGLSLWFPPMLLIVIPMFYIRSKKQLKALLE